MKGSLRYSTWFTLVVGLLMFAQWTFFLANGSVPEVRAAPIALGFHLAAEFATALALIAAGILLFLRRPFAPLVGLVANGMLLYTVIVSPGYFAQRGEWPLVVMFAVLLVLALLSVLQLYRGPADKT